jgi:hypothetical protein
MDHWPKLKELTMASNFEDDKMPEEDLILIMEQYLAAVQYAGNSLNKINAMDSHREVSAARSDNHSTSPAATITQLQSLTLGWFQKGHQLSERAVAAVVDALSKSGLSFLELSGINLRKYPAIEAQLQRNRRLWELGDLERVPATSIRLFICGDPYAGKLIQSSALSSNDQSYLTSDILNS